MGEDFTIEVSSVQWIFKPTTPRGRNWLARNFDSHEQLRVSSRRGLSFVRALQAEGLIVRVSVPNRSVSQPASNAIQ